MKITTSKGKTFDVNFIWPTNRDGGRLMIELVDDRPLAEIASDFDGNATIEKTDEKKPGVKEVFEGFNRLVLMSRENYEGVIRLTLKKDDAA